MYISNRNKQTGKAMCGSDEPYPYSIRCFIYFNEQIRANNVNRVIVYSGKFVSPTHWPSLPPQDIFLVLIYVRG